MSFAGFGQIGVNIIDGLQAQFGARYSYNRTTNSNVNWVQYGYPVSQTSVFAKSYAFTYKGSLNWTVNDNNFLYAFIATGYKPGGINPPIYSSTIPVAPFGPEKVTEYEAGWKATLLDGHLRTVLDGYYNTYKNFIVTVAYPNAPYGTYSYVTEVNDPSSTIVDGVEAEADAVFGNLSFGAGLGLMHSSLGAFYATDARVTGYSPCLPATGPAGGACVNLKGHPLTYAPSVTYDMYVQYQFDLNDGDKLTPRLSYGHEGPQWATIFDNPAVGDRLSARDLVNAQLEWKHETYVLTLYCTNLTDQHYEAALMSPLRFAGPPRQYGIRLLKVW
jgi:iron complex outermembrane receptor protein